MTWTSLGTGTNFSTTMTMEFPVSASNVAAVFGGPPSSPPRHSVQIDYLDSPLPALPVKRRHLTGKAYRIARRRHARLRRAWRRAGCPMIERRLFLPSVTITRGDAKPPNEGH